jgi:dGTPase
VVALRRPEADALAAFRAFNYERIYLRPEAEEQARRVIALIGALTEHFAEHPRTPELVPGSELAVAEAVRYVSGMTDRFALDLAVERLGWRPEALPESV